MTSPAIPHPVLKTILSCNKYGRKTTDIRMIWDLWKYDMGSWKILIHPRTDISHIYRPPLPTILLFLSLGKNCLVHAISHRVMDRLIIQKTWTPMGPICLIRILRLYHQRETGIQETSNYLLLGKGNDLKWWNRKGNHYIRME